MRVALIGSPDREEITRLAIRLEERGAEWSVIDPRGDVALELLPDTVRIGGVDCATLRGIYVADLAVRSDTADGSSADGNSAGGNSADGNSADGGASRRHLAAWNAVLARLGRTCIVINPPEAHDLHALKPFETAQYRRRRIPVPWTLATSDARELVGVAANGGGSRSSNEEADFIHKGMVGGYGYTEPFTPPPTEADAREVLRGGPCMVQERIVGAQVRTFVLEGSSIGSAEILPLAGGEVDSRRGEARLRRIEPPAEAVTAAIAVTEIAGMRFAAVDWIRDVRGGFRILECNSAPFFVSFERRSGHDISSRLADALLGRTRKKPAAQWV